MQLLVIGMLALAQERLIEMVSMSLAVQPPKIVKLAISLLLGIAAAWAFGLNLIALAGYVAPYPVAGVIVTGLGIGGGSNLINLFMKWLSITPLPAATTSEVIDSAPPALVDTPRRTRTRKVVQDTKDGPA